MLPYHPYFVLVEHYNDWLDEYLHGLLNPEDAKLVEKHCEQCPSCKTALEQARQRLALLQQPPPASEASEELIQTILQQVETWERDRPKRRRKVLRRIAGVAAAVVAVVMILGGIQRYYTNLKPPPYDLMVFGQTELISGTHGSLRVRLVNPNSGKALEGIPVNIEMRDPGADRFIKLASFTTDAQGTGQPRFQLPDWKEGDYELRVTAQTGSDPEMIARKVHLGRSWRLMLTSDRPVYQPGQTIHVRSLALHRGDLKPLAGRPATFSIADPKGNVIFKQQRTTSTYGISAVDCPLADEILEGPYTVACTVDDTQSTLTVQVKKYVLPKFKIDAELDQPYYQPGQKMEAKIHAQYFFGKPVAGASVNIEVRTNGEAKVLQRRTLKTDDTGKTTCTILLQEPQIARLQGQVAPLFASAPSLLPALPPLCLKLEPTSDEVPLPDGRNDTQLELNITIADTGGQKQTRTVSRTVTTSPLRIEVIPEGGTLVQGVSNTVYVLTTHADGRPARARLEISGFAKEIRTNSLGVASFEIKPETAEVQRSIKAIDDKGRVALEQMQFTCGQFRQDFLLRTDKAVYNGGDTVHLTVLGGGTTPVFVDFIKDHQTFLTQSIALTNGRSEAQVDLPPELFGSVTLSAYRFDKTGSALHKTWQIFIRPPSQLDIKTSLDAREYRPGGRARVMFVLTDKKRNPVPGALSLSAVDQAVLSVLDQASDAEPGGFAQEEKQVLPDVPPGITSAERTRFEQAVLARSVQSPWQGLRGDEDERGSEYHLDWSLSGSYPLSTSSFLPKAKAIGELRQSGLANVRVAWMVFCILLVVTACLLGFRKHQKLIFAALTIVCMITFVLCSGMGGGLEDRILYHFGGRSPPQSSPMEVDLVGGPVVARGRLQDPRGPHRQKEIMVLDGSASMKREEVRYTNLMHSTTLHGVDFPSRLDRFGQVGLKKAPFPAPARLREWFPETLLWYPQIITDDKGHASLDVDLADSITTWRLTTSAVTAKGQLGATQTPIKVFQPFFVDLNLPVTLTRGDEVTLPVVVHNYLKTPQKVAITLKDAPWFERLDDAVKQLEVAANEVRAGSFRIRVKKVGKFHLEVVARGGAVEDAVKRPIEVVSDGRRIEYVFSDLLERPADISFTLPKDAIEGSARAILKLYPSSFSQLVEGLDAIFRMPSGCFEQTSSTTYPNVLALDYLRHSKKKMPDIEAKAREYIHLGYQRLLSFEVEGGGFSYFGKAPALLVLTGYGLMEFQDMAQVHDVDSKLIERTRKWLLDQRKADGSWPAKEGDDDLTRYTTTAYLAWSVFGGQPLSAEAKATRTFLLSRKAETISDPYLLALVSNALLGIEPTGDAVRPYLERLRGLRHFSKDRNLVWWEQPQDKSTLFYGSGRSGAIETTALAVVALTKGKQHPGDVRLALAWLAGQKDSAGTWHSTQATVLTLKALLAGSNRPLGGDGERCIEIAWGKGGKQEIVIPADQAEVMKQLDLTAQLVSGTQTLKLTERSATAAGYQLVFRYHVPETKQEKKEALSISLAYDKTTLKVDETVQVTATAVNKSNQAAPMVMLDLPIPAGFVLAGEDFTERGAAKVQVHSRGVLVYLHALEAGKTLELRYRLRATMPVNVHVPAARVYEYYNPDREGFSQAARMIVK
jgi:hypothetical protein